MQACLVFKRKITQREDIPCPSEIQAPANFAMSGLKIAEKHLTHIVKLVSSGFTIDLKSIPSIMWLSGVCVCAYVRAAAQVCVSSCVYVCMYEREWQSVSIGLGV